MKATFSAREPNILMEAQPGDLFVPLGPDLVECVCAVRTTGMADTNLDPNARLVVVVVACRVEKGDPEHYPTGYTTSLVGATPISFLEQVEPAAFRERGGISDETLRVFRKQLFPSSEPLTSYPDDFEVRPIHRTPAASAGKRPDDASTGVCVGGFSYPDHAKPIAAVESTGAPISRL